MVVIKRVAAKAILDTRDEKTISVSISTKIGEFSASAPNGKSTGKYENDPYKKSIDNDIKKLKDFSDYFSEEKLEEFADLTRVEDIIKDTVGANTLFAFESAVLKAIAKEQKKEIWQLMNPHAKKFPRLLGNAIEGGKHSHAEKRPDFQEFLFIPHEKTVKESFELNRKIRNNLQTELKIADEKFKGKRDDEGGWETSLNDKEVLDIAREFNIPLGVDIAASTFHKRKKYLYSNPMLKRDPEEQMEYLSNLIKNFNLFYVEDPFEENDFESFSKLLKRFPNTLITGDDLTVTDVNRLRKAISVKAINAIIVKPNQTGSLIEVRDVCELAKKNGIKIVFSHRSGETEESILADLAFGFGSDFFKAGIEGKGREVKIKRLIEIERNL